MMTFEEFKNLALNPPKTNEPAIFRLKVLHIEACPNIAKRTIRNIKFMNIALTSSNPLKMPKK